MKKILSIVALLLFVGCNKTNIEHFTDERSGHQYIKIWSDFKSSIEVIHDPDCIKCEEKKNSYTNYNAA